MSAIRLDLAVLALVVLLAGAVAAIEQPQKQPQFRDDWRPAEVEAGDGAAVAAIAAVQDRAIAVGHREHDDGRTVAAVWETTDGHVWRRSALGRFGVEEGVDSRLTAIARGSGQQLLAAGVIDGEVVLLLSEDGASSWSRVEDGPLGRGEVRAITHHSSGGWLAAGSEPHEGGRRGVLWRSPDGHAWQRVDAPSFGDDGHEALLAIGSGGDGVLAAGVSLPGQGSSRTPLWTSVEGRQWSQLADQEGLTGPPVRITSMVNTSESLLAAVQRGEDGSGEALVATSLDGGLTWELGEPLTEHGRIAAISQAPGESLVAVGSDGEAPAVWLSQHGEDWQPVSSPALSSSGPARATVVGALHGNLLVIGTEESDGGRHAVAWVNGPPRQEEQAAR